MAFESTVYLLVTLDNRGVQEPPVPRGDATLISQYKIKMPGYGKRMERYAPEPTNETPELEQRFVMPKVTLVQLTILAMIAYYAYTVRKMNRAVVPVAAFAIGLLHMYDHMYRIKRGDERLFFFPEAKKEGYCGACRK